MFKGKVLLELFNKRKLRNGTKTYLEQILSLFIVRFRKLGFSAPLSTLLICFIGSNFDPTVMHQ